MQKQVVTTMALLAVLLTGVWAQSDQGEIKMMHQSMQTMMQRMQAAPMSGDADHDFAAMMVPHHQGAIDMARMELQYGKDPTLRTMAQNMVTSQEKEITRMQAWLHNHPGQAMHMQMMH